MRSYFCNSKFNNYGSQRHKTPHPLSLGRYSVQSGRRQPLQPPRLRPVAQDRGRLLGQLLWSAVGINRPDAPAGPHGAPADRTNPTALNWQEIRAYVFRTDGVFEYIPASHSLRLVKEGDRRSLLAGTAEFSQDFVNDAPCAVLFVADMTNLPDNDQVHAMVHVDAGIACENLNLACAALGVATVPRATMDTGAITTLLGLTPRQLPILNNPIGYAR